MSSCRVRWCVCVCLCLCVFVCVFVCVMCVFMRERECVCVCMCWVCVLWERERMCVCERVCIFVCLFNSPSVCVYVCMFTFACLFMCAFWLHTESPNSCTKWHWIFTKMLTHQNGLWNSDLSTFEAKWLQTYNINTVILVYKIYKVNLISREVVLEDILQSFLSFLYCFFQLNLYCRLKIYEAELWFIWSNILFCKINMNMQLHRSFISLPLTSNNLEAKAVKQVHMYLNNPTLIKKGFFWIYL